MTTFNSPDLTWEEFQQNPDTGFSLHEHLFTEWSTRDESYQGRACVGELRYKFQQMTADLLNQSQTSNEVSGDNGNAAGNAGTESSNSQNDTRQPSNTINPEVIPPNLDRIYEI